MRKYTHTHMPLFSKDEVFASSSSVVKTGKASGESRVIDGLGHNGSSDGDIFGKLALA